MAARERAVRLASSPVVCERLAELREQWGADPVRELRQAAALEPFNAARWLRLGAAAEWSGDVQTAGSCYRRAAELSRLYQPRYALAQYYFRTQDAAAFRKTALSAFRVSSGDISPLLDLCWRLNPDGPAFERLALASPPRSRPQFLDYLVRRRQTAAASALARALSEETSTADLPALYRFCDLALGDADPSDAAAVWNVLCRRGLIPYGAVDPESGASTTNARLQRPAIATGFDWHIDPPAGIRVQELAGEWHVAFSGLEPEGCLFAWQYVPLIQGRNYRVRIDAAPLDAASVAGIGWSLFYPRTGRSWDEWIPGGDPVFTARAAVARLALTYRRPLGSPRLEGGVAIRGVYLELVP